MPTLVIGQGGGGCCCYHLIGFNSFGFGGGVFGDTYIYFGKTAAVDSVTITADDDVTVTIDGQNFVLGAAGTTTLTPDPAIEFAASESRTLVSLSSTGDSTIGTVMVTGPGWCGYQAMTLSGGG